MTYDLHAVDDFLSYFSEFWHITLLLGLAVTSFAYAYCLNQTRQYALAEKWKIAMCGCAVASLSMILIHFFRYPTGQQPCSILAYVCNNIDPQIFAIPGSIGFSIAVLSAYGLVFGLCLIAGGRRSSS